MSVKNKKMLREVLDKMVAVKESMTEFSVDGAPRYFADRKLFLDRKAKIEAEG